MNSNPFSSDEIHERRLRYDVLCLAHKLWEDGAAVKSEDSAEGSITAIATALMDFINDKAALTAA